MSDAVYRPNDNAEPTPPPSEPLVIRQQNLDEWRTHQREHGMEVDKRLPEPAPMTPAQIGEASTGRSSDDAVAREMSTELRKQREQASGGKTSCRSSSAGPMQSRLRTPLLQPGSEPIRPSLHTKIR